jgi:Cu(I)/Ag(I) efflux system periplasmic protein CusF
MKRFNTIAGTMMAGAALLFLVSSTAAASSHSHGSGHDSHGAAAGSHQQMMKQADAKAQVLAVAPDGKSLEIDHLPIPELGWPAMQMSLELENPDLAQGIAAGDQVTVTIRQLSATRYVISGIAKE